MAITVACPNCQARLAAPDAAAGKRVKCAKCQQILVVPEAAPGFEVVEVPEITPLARPPASVRNRVIVEDEEEPIRPMARNARPADEDDDDDERPVRRRRRRDEDDDDDEDDRPRRKKKSQRSRGFLDHPAVMIVGGLLGVAVAAGVLYAVWSTQEKEQVNAGNQPAGVKDYFVVNGPRLRPGNNDANPPVEGPADWRSFSLPDTPLTVSFPVRPLPPTAPGGEQQQGGTAVVYLAAHNNMLYQVSVITPDEPPPPDVSTGTILDQLAAGMILAGGLGKETSRTSLLVGGHRGRQLVFANGDKNAVIRMTYVDGRVYILSVVSPRAFATTDPAVVPFFDSVKIADVGARAPVLSPDRFRG